LRRGVVLELTVSSDFPLQLDEIFGALVGIAERLEPDGTEGDKQCCNSEERDQ
jgi:hypothetical protein